MYSISSTTSAIASMFLNTGTVLSATIITVLAGLVALLGLGFAVNKLAKYITGSGDFTPYRVGTSDEYPDDFRKAFTSVVAKENEAQSWRYD